MSEFSPLTPIRPVPIDVPTPYKDAPFTIVRKGGLIEHVLYDGRALTTSKIVITETAPGACPDITVSLAVSECHVVEARAIPAHTLTKMALLSRDLLLGYDAVAVDTIPSNASLVFYYDIPNTLPYVLARFPNATRIGITTQAAPGYRMCDMETGDLDPPQAAQWAQTEIQSGRPSWDKPTIYCNAENFHAVFLACADLGLRLGDATDLTCDVWWFEAWWNDEPDLICPPSPPWPHFAEPVGHQFFRESEFTYDIDIALSSWVYPAPPAPVRIKYPTEDFMFIRNPGPGALVVPAGAATEGAICLVSPAGAINLGTDWTQIEEDYASLNVPLVVHDLPATLYAAMKIAYTPYAPLVEDHDEPSGRSTPYPPPIPPPVDDPEYVPGETPQS